MRLFTRSLSWDTFEFNIDNEDFLVLDDLNVFLQRGNWVEDNNEFDLRELGGDVCVNMKLDGEPDNETGSRDGESGS